MTYQRISATHVGKHVEEDSPRRYCRRCPTEIRGRATTVHCIACDHAIRTERKAARLGIDLAALADDEWFSPKGRIYKIREKVAA